MGDEADRLAGPRPQRPQRLVQAVAHDLVQRAERFVHQQDVGVERQRPRNRGALLHPARQLPRIAPGELRQLHQFQHAGDPLLPVGAVEAHDLERQQDVPGDGPPRIQPRRLEHIAIGPRPPRLIRRHAVDGQLPRGRAFQRRDRAQERRLAAARGADEADELPLADGQAHVFQRMDRPVGGGEGEGDAPCLDHRGGGGRGGRGAQRGPGAVHHTPLTGMPPRGTGRGAVSAFQLDSARLTSPRGSRATNSPCPSRDDIAPSVTATWPRVRT